MLTARALVAMTGSYSILIWLRHQQMFMEMPAYQVREYLSRGRGRARPLMMTAMSKLRRVWATAWRMASRTVMTSRWRRLLRLRGDSHEHDILDEP